MTETGLTNWGKRYGITLADVKTLQWWIDRYAKQRENFCNGDPHPDNPRPGDKSRNSEYWDRSSERTAASLTTIIEDLGFTGIDFGVGLYPALAKGQETCIMVPDPDDND